MPMDATPFRYQAYGLAIQSNTQVPALAPTSSQGVPQVRLWMGKMPEFFPGGAASCGDPYPGLGEFRDDTPVRASMHLNGSWLLLLYEDGTTFLVDRAGTEIWCTWPDCFTIEDAATYLLGPVLGLVLRLRGDVPLHASCVARQGKAVAFVGAGGAGKSTTAAFLASAGFDLVSEDVTVVDLVAGGATVRNGYPMIRLWKESAGMLFGPDHGLPLLTPNWDKLGLACCDRGGEEVPALDALYVLQPRRDEPSRPALRRLGAQEALMALVTHSYVNYLLDRKMRAHEMGFLGGLVRAVPVYALTPGSGAAGLEALGNMLRGEAETIFSRVPRIFS
jgi:hypothetical protein